jgi:SsrA-binding protein
LLLNKKEISEIKRELDQKGKSCVPLNLRIERGLFKLEIGIVKGKKEYEKKVVAKEKQEKREMEKEKKKLGTWA